MSAAELADDSDKNLPVVIERKPITVLPAPQRIDLSNARDVRLEMAAIYRATKEGKLEENRAAKLVYMLREIGALIRTQEVEQRVDALERAINYRKVSK